jgi:hypothetical protein
MVYQSLVYSMRGKCPIVDFEYCFLRIKLRPLRGMGGSRVQYMYELFTIPHVPTAGGHCSLNEASAATRLACKKNNFQSRNNFFCTALPPFSGTFETQFLVITVPRNGRALTNVTIQYLLQFPQQNLRNSKAVRPSHPYRTDDVPPPFICAVHLRYIYSVSCTYKCDSEG